MARVQARRPENVGGNFYVDSTCIDCDTCRWMASEVFERAGEQSAVYHQPDQELEKLKAYQALLSCPTASIGTTEVETAATIKQVEQSFPLPIAENVYHCGYHSPSSYAAASYFILREEGNILVDSPRFSPPLVKRLEEMGGIKYLYLTHRDDVADHQKFRDHFHCDRLLHVDDITDGTRGVEIQLTGEEAINFAPDLVIIPVPGHTKGHTVLIYRQKYLFAGDHLAWSEQRQQLTAFQDYCWYSWEMQKQSLLKLTHYTFEWVLPGHGRRFHSDYATMQEKMQQYLANIL